MPESNLGANAKQVFVFRETPLIFPNSRFTRSDVTPVRMLTFSHLATPRLSLHEWACIQTELIWSYHHPPLNAGKAVEYDHRRGNWAWYFVSGHGWTEGPSGVLRAKAGMWLFPPREIMRQYFSPDANIISVHFHCHWPSGEDLIASPEGLVITGQDYPQLQSAAKHLCVMVNEHFPDGDAESHKYQAERALDFDPFLRLQSLFLEWLAVWFRVRVECGATFSRLRSGDDRLLKAVRCLNAASLEEGFPMGALKAATGLSQVHLNRLFVAAHGITTRKYWERRQLKFACACLETSNMPVKEIAYRTGFHSTSHFVVWFRRLSHVPPTDYRRQSLSMLSE